MVRVKPISKNVPFFEIATHDNLYCSVNKNWSEDYLFFFSCNYVSSWYEDEAGLEGFT